MRNECQDPTGDVVQHERPLIAMAREQAAQTRARAAVAWNPRYAGPFSADPMNSLRDLLPGYELQQEIHRGGQGVVYQALQKSAGRQVAIKVMKEGPFAGTDDKARFDREVRILGQLNHPNIVTIHDSGTAAGCFYFVMDYIAGSPLDAYMRDTERTLEETLRLFVKICDGVNAAHLRGIIHRDLKPSNIRIDADAEPHILDFGLAKVEDGSSALGGTIIPAMTRTGQFVGSLPWASPEQVADVAGGIDVRSDVYSLGVVLYHMLSGTFPYDLSGNMHDVVQRILHTEPISPRAVSARSSGLGRLLGAKQGGSSHCCIDDEVETVVLKCLSKQREHRYQNAGELARDIRHYLAGEPIDAKRDSTWYVLKKTARRHKIPVMVATTFVALVATFAVGMTILASRLAAERNLAREQRTASNIERGRMLAMTGNAPAAEELIWAEFLEAAGTVEGDLSQAFSHDPVLRHAYWALWELYARQPCLTTIPAHTGSAACVAFSPNGRSLASTGMDGNIKLWAVPSGDALATLSGHDGHVSTVCFSPDGRSLASGGRDTTIKLWDLDQRRCVATLVGHTAAVREVAYSPDGRSLASAGSDTTVRIWDVASGTCSQTLTEHSSTVRHACFSADGRWLATYGTDKTVLWDWPALKPITTLEAPGFYPGGFSYGSGLRFGPNSRRLATALGRQIQLWELPSGRQIDQLRGHTSDVHALAFNPDGGMLASGSRDKTIGLWDVDAAKRLRAYSGHTALVQSVTFDPSGRMLASSSSDGTIKLWEVSPYSCLTRLPAPGGTVHSIRFSPDGRLLAAAGGVDNVVIQLLDAATGELRASLTGHTKLVSGVAFSPDGRLLASAGYDKTVRLWDVTTRDCRATFTGHDGQINYVSFSPDGGTIASASDDLTVKLWDVSSGRCLKTLQRHTKRIAAACFSPDGRTLASCSNDATVILWDVASGDVRGVLEAHQATVHAISFSPDGALLASGSDDRTVKLWDVASRTCLATLEGHTADLFTLCFRPDGRILASGSRGGTIKLWDVATRRCLATLEGHENAVFSVDFSPDGRTLASGSADRTIGLWDLTYYDRHIAGNLEYQAARLFSASDAPSTPPAVKAWADQVRNGG